MKYKIGQKVTRRQGITVRNDIKGKIYKITRIRGNENYAELENIHDKHDTTNVYFRHLEPTTRSEKIGKLKEQINR